MSSHAGPSSHRRDSDSQEYQHPSPNKKPRISLDDTPTDAKSAPRRAAQACLRCRKQKLRCLGGWPCARCIKANKDCDFGKPGQQFGGSDGDAEGASARLQHLESSVADLLAGLSRSGNGGPSQRPNDGWSAYQSDRTILPQVPMGTALPGISQRSASSHWSSPHQARTNETHPNWAQGEQETEDNGKGKGVAAEERLASATREGFEPPFRALVYHPSVWENRERSRRASPQRDDGRVLQPQLRHRDRATGDDPVSAGIVTAEAASCLATFYAAHCHPFLPIIDFTADQPLPSIDYAPALFSAVLAIAARFYGRFHSRPTSPHPAFSLDNGVAGRLAELAEHHLAQTLLQKQHTLADVQAILLLAAWGLQSGGRGPDAWVLTGHAARIARRLGFHKLIRQAAAISSSPDRHLQHVPQWRTCLAWYSFDSFLSLGFGRPQSTQFESIDEAAFLEARLRSPIPRPGSAACTSFYGDVYLAGLAELAHIARGLVQWTEGHGSRPASVSGGGGRAMSMLEDLNGRLDEWSKKWIWSGSRYSLYLGSAARIARLQAEHLRLSINSIALRPSSLVSPDDDASVLFLRKALNAATSTIQTHFESSQTDLFLSFATDYLTITLAQAAVFLIRLTKAPIPVQRNVSLDSSVVAHYLTMSIDLLEQGDISETRLSSYLAKTVREIARAAGIDVRPDDPPTQVPAPVVDPGSTGQSAVNHGESENGLDESTTANLFDADAFWAGNDQFDLGYFLGLSGDSGQVANEWTETSGAGTTGGNGTTDLLEAFANSWDTSFGMNGSA